MPFMNFIGQCTASLDNDTSRCVGALDLILMNDGG